MGRVDEAFQRFFESSGLTKGQEEQVSKRLAAMQGFLQRQWGTPEVLPIGSYARGTLVPPVRDVDVLFVFGAQLQGSTTDVLREVNRALAAQYGGATRVQRHSVRVLFQDFAIDVVPAYKKGEGYVIPELKEHGELGAGGQWIATNPRAHEERLRAANATWNGGATRLITTLKSMNQRQGTRLKSFHLEELVLARLVGSTRGTGTFATLLPGWCEGLASDVAASGEAYLTPKTRGDIANRYRNDAATLREALANDDVARAREVVPGLP